MRTVYLIRHAQSEENALAFRERTTPAAFNDILLRSHASPLTEQGQQQAQEVITKLVGARIEHLYTSPFTRALTTATVLGKALGLEPEVIDDLHEAMPRPLGKRYRNHSLGGLFIRGYLEMFVPWGEGESVRTAYRRAQHVWSYITSTPADEIAAVSHSALLSLMLLSLRRDPHWRILERDLSNGGVSIIAKV